MPATIPNTAVITVSLDESTSRVTVTVNGNDIIHNEAVPADGILSWGTVHYGGITAASPGFRVTKILSMQNRMMNNHSTC